VDWEYYPSSPPDSGEISEYTHRELLELMHKLRDMFSIAWDDLRFPFIGRNIETASGRINYDWNELGITFQNNSRYHVNEQVSMIVQLPHAWEIGTNLKPHFHWIQSASVNPNWMMEYRSYNNGEIIPASWSQSVSTPVFTYPGSGSILQISTFPEIDMSAITNVSGFVDVKFFRDVSNGSALFAGPESGPSAETVKEFDMHYKIDSRGSRQEYIK